MLYAYVLIGLLAIAVLWQLVVWMGEIQNKKVQSHLAVAASRKYDKPLLIAGGPWGGRPLRRRLKIPAHIMGDVSIDISPGAVDGHPNGIVATVTHLPFREKTFGAALASHLLEHLNDTNEAKLALDELNRVSEKVFIAYPSRQSLIAWLLPDHRLWVWQKGDRIFLKQRRLKDNVNEELYDLANG